MKNIILFLALTIISNLAYGTCSSPISRTSFSPNTVLPAATLNTQLNTVYNKVNALDGDCLETGSVPVTALEDASITKAKLATGAKDLNVQSKTATYTILNTDEIVYGDATAGAMTFNLPTAASISGRQIRIEKTDSSYNAITIDGNGSETISGSTTIKLATQYESVTLVSDGTNWQTLSRKNKFYLGSKTTTGTWVSNATYSGVYWREGSFLLGVVTITCSGAPTATTLSLTLPDSLSMDTAKLSIGANTLARVEGEGYAADSGGVGYLVSGEYAGSATSITLMAGNAAATYVSRAGVSNTVPITFGANDTVTFRYRVPISGWED